MRIIEVIPTEHFAQCGALSEQSTHILHVHLMERIPVHLPAEGIPNVFLTSQFVIPRKSTLINTVIIWNHPWEKKQQLQKLRMLLANRK